MSLIVHIQPKSDESLHGLLRRVSESNFAPSVKHLLSALGLKQKASYSDLELTCLAEAIGVDQGELAARRLSADHMNPILRTKYRTSNHLRVCPACLVESAYQRLGWEHLLVSACPTHGVQLASECPACAQPITQDGPLSVCGCGHPLAQVQTRKASTAEIGLSALLMNIDVPARASLPPAWRTAPAPSDVVELLALLGKNLGAITSCVPVSGSGRGRTSPEILNTQVLAGFTLLQDWPHRFNDALGMRLASTEGPGLAKRLGSWYRDLHTRFTHPVYDCLREALVEHLTGRFDGHLNLRLSTIDPEHLKDKCWLTSAEAGRLIGMGAELVRSGVLTGDIQGKVTVKGKNRFVSVHKEVVEQVKRDRLAYYDATATRKQLGVSKVLFERLMQAGALRKHTKAERPPLVAGEFLAQEVTALVQRLVEATEPQVIPEERLIGLHDLSVRRGISADRICSVLHKILALEIRPVALNTALHGLGGLRFDLAAVQDEVQDASIEPSFLITDLVRWQGWKHESILQWIKQGSLKASEELEGGVSRTRISLSALMAFMSEFAVLADLAARTGSKSPHLLRGLMPAKVKPVGVTASGSVQRGVLVRVDDLLQAAQWNKRPGRFNADAPEISS